jgi:hypothetical protein
MSKPMPNPMSNPVSRRSLMVLAFVTASLSASAAFAQRSDVASTDASAPPLPAGAREVEVIVDNAYSPSVIEVTEGEPLRLRFVRRDYSPCSREVVFPTLNVRRMLPTNQPVVIDLPALSVGEHPFQCWMNMLRGRIVVRARPAAPPADAGAPAPSRPAPRARPRPRR